MPGIRLSHVPVIVSASIGVHLLFGNFFHWLKEYKLLLNTGKMLENKCLNWMHQNSISSLFLEKYENLLIYCMEAQLTLFAIQTNLAFHACITFNFV